jgi:hypothetical protein
MNIIDFLKNYWKLILFVIIVISSFGAGYYLRPAEVIEKEKIVYKEKTDTASHTHTQIIQKPDGTTETIIVNDTTTSTDIASTETSIKEIKALPNYSVAATAEFESILRPLDKAPSYKFTAGYRILGPFWIEASYNIITKGVGAGGIFEW